MENVDKTIDVICNWIQKVLNGEIDAESNVLTEMVKALAELVATKKELQAVRSRLEFNRFVPEDSNGKHTENLKSEPCADSNQKYFP